MLFKSIKQLKMYMGGIQRNMNWDTFEAFVREADQFFTQKEIGKELLDALSEKVPADGLELTEETSDKEKELINILRISVAGYTDFLSSYRLILSTGDSGKTMNTAAGTTAPTKWSAIGSMQAALSRGDMAMEDALVYLEKNADDFEDWKNSDFYTVFNDCYVRTATQLTESFPFTKNSRRIFVNLKAELMKAQGTPLNQVMGADFNAVMKERIGADDLTEEEKILLKHISNVVSMRAVSEAIPYLNINENWRLVSQIDGYGDETILPDSRRDEIALQVSEALELSKNELTKYLQDTASAEVFPEYFTSSLYENRAESGTSSRFVNKKEKKYAVL